MILTPCVVRPRVLTSSGADPDDDSVGVDHHDLVLFAYECRSDQQSGLAELGLVVGRDALAAAGLQPVLIERRALSESVLGDDEHLACLVDIELHRDDFIVLLEQYRSDSAGVAAHRSYVLLAERDRLALLGDYEHVLVSVGQRDADQLVAFLQRDRDEAGLAVGVEFGHRSLLDGSLLGDHHKALVCVELPDRDHGRHALGAVEVEEVDDRRALGCPRSLRYLVCLDLVDAAHVGEEHEIVVRAGDDEVAHEVALASS